MKQTSMVIIAVLVLAAIGFGLYSVMSDAEPAMNDSKKMADESMVDESMADESMADESMADESMADESMMNESGQYLVYTPELFANNSSNRRLLFFYADWCPTCKPVDENLSENTSEIPTDLTILRVNYNDSQTDEAEKDLAKKYGVTYQHTFVQVDSSGNEVAKWNGGNLTEIISNIK